VVISALLSEAGDDAVRAAADGRFRLPEEWRFLALAAAGQAEAQEVVGRLAAGTEDRDAALRAAAARLNAPGAVMTEQLARADHGIAPTDQFAERMAELSALTTPPA
jgi:hypothetical protein